MIFLVNYRYLTYNLGIKKNHLSNFHCTEFINDNSLKLSEFYFKYWIFVLFTQNDNLIEDEVTVRIIL